MLNWLWRTLRRPAPSTTRWVELMGRLRDIKRRARGSLHREMSVPALYFVTSTTRPGIECAVRVWPKTENQMVGDLPGVQGAERAEPEDRLRFDLADFPPSRMPRRLGVVSVEPGEAYRIDHLYPADLGYQTARVTRLSAEEAATYPVPE